MGTYIHLYTQMYTQTKHTHRHTHTHTFSRTVSAEGLGECGGVGDVVGWILFRHQGNHWAICHLKQGFQQQLTLHSMSSSRSTTIYFQNCYSATVQYFLSDIYCICRLNAPKTKKTDTEQRKMLCYLVVSQGVESLPVIVYLSGDVLVLKDDAGHPALPPFCHTHTCTEEKVRLCMLYV